MLKRIQGWVEENPEKVAYGLAAAGAYGTYRLLKWLYKTALADAQAATPPSTVTSMGDAEPDICTPFEVGAL